MSTTPTPIFTQTPVIGSGQVSTANTNRDGTGALATILSGGTNGTRIDRITAQAIVTTAAGTLRLFIYDGTNTRLWRELLTSAVTPSATVAGASVSVGGPGSASLGLILPSGYSLKACINNSETWNVIAEGGNF